MKFTINVSNSAILSAVGLVGLAVYQISQGDYGAAVQSFFGALVAFGVIKGQNQQQELNLRLATINKRYASQHGS